MKKILIVDDNRVCLSVAADLLQEAGYSVSLRQESIGTGAAVLRERPDIVLLDVSMPNLSGESLVGILQEEIPDERRPVVLLYSERSVDELKRLAEQCGADGFVTKGGGGEELLKAIDSALQSKSAAK